MVLLPPVATGTGYYNDLERLGPEFAWYPSLICEIQATNVQLIKIVDEEAIPDLRKSNTIVGQHLYPMHVYT